MSWSKKLGRLVGGNAKPPGKKTAPAKTYNPPSKRAELLAEALAIHQRGREQTQEVLEKALRELAAKPPRPSDTAAMTRLLTLRQAVLAMRASIASDSRRPKVLAGIKALMGPP